MRRGCDSALTTPRERERSRLDDSCDEMIKWDEAQRVKCAFVLGAESRLSLCLVTRVYARQALSRWSDFSAGKYFV